MKTTLQLFTTNKLTLVFHIPTAFLVTPVSSTLSFLVTALVTGIFFKVYLWARDLLWKEKEDIQNVTLEIHLHLTTTLTLGQKELSVAVRWLFQGDTDVNTPVFFFSKNSFGQKNCLLQHTNKCGLIIFLIKNFSNHSLFWFFLQSLSVWPERK